MGAWGLWPRELAWTYMHRVCTCMGDKLAWAYGCMGATGWDDTCLNLSSYALKANVPNSFTHLTQTTIFEWYVVCCGFKNGRQKYTCLKEIGLHAQDMITILGSIFNIIDRGPEDHIWPFKKHINLYCNNVQDIHMSSKIYENSDYCPPPLLPWFWICKHLVRIVYSIS